MGPQRILWKQVVLVGVSVWAIILVVLFTYFMETKIDEQAPSSHSFVESKSVAPLQGKMRAIMGAVKETLITEVQDNLYRNEVVMDSFNEGSESIEEWNELGYSEEFPLEEERNLNKTENDSLAAGQPGFHNPSSRRGATEENDLLSWAQALKKNSLNSQRHHLLEDSMELEEFYLSSSKSLLYKLWKGNVSIKMLNPRLQRAVKEYLNFNKHGVRFRGRKSRKKLSAEELLCELKRKIQLKTIDGKEPPFSALGWEKYVPRIPLNKLNGYRSCAVVTSAGAILDSSLGKEIDSHEAVLRFNSAPTQGYEKDVGNKTTIRIVNSQILTNPSQHFMDNPLYKDGILVAWDPAPYSVNLKKWYNKPDYDLFTPYVQYRLKYPGQPFYILHPRFIWQLWDIIQENTQEKIQPNPPSSGFIGILLMMSMCKEVHVYEFIPSVRQTDLCHYYERYYDAACTLGAYHPVLYEKLLIQRMNKGKEEDLYRKGKVVLPGFSAMRCTGKNLILQS
ncbi:beta-galactoside alpha-2,6-sialyltransferase 2 [Latimeria chalumnae]|nr:PREDICTED: beta-galactoside alpha-2,6-sialyltransferase 2 [Latimeria chalumnae]|eukprot:XP_005998062.1 PREDICTED: beta-galactoside alpha-2,6-sialyltransferase 2 [Latimeria chalumnae]